jgi:CRISPR-associated protein Csm4
MAQWTTYRLDPKRGTGFHFGLRGLEQEDSAAHCPSDTLFAALVATLADLEGDAAVKAFTDPINDRQSPFLLTSVFPRAGNLLLFPFPAIKVELTQQPGQRKLLKRLRYVSPIIFKRILERQPMDAYADQKDEQGVFLQGGKVWLAVEETDALPAEWQSLSPDKLQERRVWRSRPVDRVTVDRISSASAVYRIGRTVYAPNCGLWFGVQWPDGIDTDAQTQLETLLWHLGDRGLGGERSVGYGQFTWDTLTSPLDLPEPASESALLTLSRYLPRKEELPAALRGNASYRLVTIAGWLNAPGQQAQRRRQVRMLMEGSVFEPVVPAPWGRLTDVQPKGWDAHPIWRWGYACPVGVAPAPKEVRDA